MKWGMRFLGCLDLITFLIFISPKLQYLISTYNLPFSILQKTSALIEVLILFLFLFASYFLWKNKTLGLTISFLLIPFRLIYLYFSFDFISYLAYYLGLNEIVSSAYFQYYWFYILLVLEIIRFTISVYWYKKLN
jgi:hypothetical protein